MADSKKTTRKQASASSTSGKKTAGSKTVRKKINPVSSAVVDQAEAPAASMAAANNAASDEPMPTATSAEHVTPAAASARTSGSAVVWISLLLAMIACGGLGLLVLNKGVAYFLSPAADELATAAVADDPRLRSVASTQNEQAQQLQQLTSSIDELQQSMRQQSTQQDQMAQLEATLQGQTSAAADSVNQLSSNLSTLQGQQQHHTDRINELAAALAQLQARQNDNEAELQRQFVLLQLRQRLDEISALLRSGRQQLLLNGNQQAALDAYDLATRALQNLPTIAGLLPASQLGELQQALISERAQLASISSPDVDNLLAELHGLADAVPNWPLLSDASKASTTADDDSAASDADNSSGWWQQLRGNLGHLVTVRNTDQPQLSIDEQLKLKRHLQLQLRTAALLALQQRADAWASTLDSIDGFIQLWFDSDNRGVAAARQRLRELARIELQPDWPQPQQALQLLANLQASASLQQR